MAKSKETKDELQIVNTDVTIKLLKDYQHPAGALKKAGSFLTVTPEYAEELLQSEGLAEIVKN